MRIAEKNVTHIFREEMERGRSSKGWDGSVPVLLYRKSSKPNIDYDVISMTLHIAELDEHYVLLSKAREGVPAKIMKLEDYQGLDRIQRIAMGNAGSSEFWSSSR